MSSITRFFIVPKNSSEWDYLHKKNPDFISVTSLITFYGFGYKSRNSLLIKEENKKLTTPLYLQKCFDHGNKYEPEAIEFMANHTRLDVFQIPDLSCSKGALVGTPDAYYSTEEGEMGIMEIKCPFGNKYGRFDKEDLYIGYEKKKFKHWLQLQLYLYLHNSNEFDYTPKIKQTNTPFFKEGKLVYYYPHADEGNPLALVLSFPYVGNEVMEKEFKIHEVISEYFLLFDKKNYRLQSNPDFSFVIKTSQIELLQE